MRHRILSDILLILFILLIFSSSINIVYSQPRNVAADPGNGGNETETESTPSIFDSTPDELDIKLLEIIESMSEAINITKKVDEDAANVLEDLRDSFITNIATGDLEEAERDMRLFTQILGSILRDEDIAYDLSIEDITDLNDILSDLYTGGSIPDDLGEFVNPPRDITSPPPEIIKEFNESITPSLNIPTSINTYLYGISYYLTSLFAILGISLLLYLNRRRMLSLIDEVSVRIGIKRGIYSRELESRDFYKVFLEIASKMGYPKEEYEGPVEHVDRIHDNYLRRIGYDVAYTFEDYKYGLKDIDENRLSRIYKYLREGR